MTWMEVKPTRPSRTDIHEGSARIVRSKTDAVESGDDGQGEWFGTDCEELFEEKVPDENVVKFDNFTKKIKKNKLV